LFLTKRPTPRHADLQLFQHCFIPFAIDQPHPIPRPIHRPALQLHAHAAASPSPIQTRPCPILRPFHHSGPQRVALHITHHGQKIPALLTQKTFEPPLKPMPPPPAPPIFPPPPNMRAAQPPNKPRQIRPLSRPQHQMPVIPHQTIPQNPHPAPPTSFFEQL